MDEGAFQGIFQPAPSFFPDNHACQEARKGDKEREEFSKSKKLCYKNVLPEYFYEPRGGIKSKLDPLADLFQGRMAIGIGIKLSSLRNVIAGRFFGKSS